MGSRRDGFRTHRFNGEPTAFKFGPGRVRPVEPPGEHTELKDREDRT
jgi:hypothetical protein